MEHHLTSSELLRRCLIDRRDADWHQFHQRHSEMLRRILASMLLRRLPRFASCELDDALQNLYLRLLRYGGKYAGSSDRELWSFLCRTAASVVVDTWRQLCRRGRWVMVSAGLLRTTEALLEVLHWAHPPPSGKRAFLLSRLPPEAYLDRGPEALLLAREAAFARYFKLPRRRRRMVWRRNSDRPV